MVDSESVHRLATDASLDLAQAAAIDFANSLDMNDNKTTLTNVLFLCVIE